MPKITTLRLHLSKLCQEYRGLFFSGHGVFAVCCWDAQKWSPLRYVVWPGPIHNWNTKRNTVWTRQFIISNRWFLQL